MITIDITPIEKTDIYIGDGDLDSFELPIGYDNVKVFISGLIQTIGEDYDITNNKVNLFEKPLQDENIQIMYYV